MKTRIYICALAALFMIPLAVTAQTKKKAKKEVAIQLYSVRDILNKVDNKNGKCDPTYTALLKKQPIITTANFMTVLPNNLRKMSNRQD